MTTHTYLVFGDLHGRILPAFRLAIIRLAKPKLAVFGHYHCPDRFDDCDFGATEVFHLAGMEFHGSGHSADPRSVGVLKWNEPTVEFEYVDPKWLATITRQNWKCR